MKRKIFTLLLLLICSHCVFAQKKVKAEEICITELENEIYTAAGIQFYSSKTTSYPVSDYVTGHIPGISPDVIADFTKKNERPYSLKV